MDERSARKTLKKQYQRQNEYIKTNYDRVSVTLPKGTKERITSAGYTVNAFIKESVLDRLEALEAGQE